jgi:hypothetical protein
VFTKATGVAGGVGVVGGVTGGFGIVTLVEQFELATAVPVLLKDTVATTLYVPGVA